MIFFYVRGAGGGRSEMKGSGRRDGEGMIMIAPVQYYSTNHKLGRTVCNFANFGCTNMIQVGIPLVLLFLIVSLLWIFLQVSFW